MLRQTIEEESLEDSSELINAQANFTNYILEITYKIASIVSKNSKNPYYLDLIDFDKILYIELKIFLLEFPDFEVLDNEEIKKYNEEMIRIMKEYSVS